MRRRGHLGDGEVRHAWLDHDPRVLELDRQDPPQPRQHDQDEIDSKLRILELIQSDVESALGKSATWVTPAIPAAPAAIPVVVSIPTQILTGLTAPAAPVAPASPVGPVAPAPAAVAAPSAVPAPAKPPVKK